MKRELTNKEDLEFLFRAFYERVLEDEVLQAHFKNFDLEHHLPRMVDFWALLLLDEPGYSSNVIEKHQHMEGLKKEHFESWQNHFLETLDSHFVGEKVRLAKEKLGVLRWTMEAKLVP